MRLSERSWNDPLEGLYAGMKFHLNPPELEDFESSYTRYKRKLSHLKLIWRRLREDIDAHESFLEVAFGCTEKGGKFREYTPEELSAMEAHQKRSETLQLDMEDFFIHAKILMDRIAGLTCFLLKDHSFRKMHSFTNLRKFFNRPKNTPYEEDEDFAKYIREKTGWYDTLLKSYRDQLIVHDVTSSLGGVISGPTDVPRVIRAKRKANKRWEELWKKLMQIREKYLNRIPGLKEVSLNVYELLDFLDAHGNLIAYEDIATLAEIRKGVGGKLPDIALVADHMIEFLKYYNAHFLQKIPV